MGIHYQPRVLVVAHSHLDVQWRWTVRDTIERFLPRTVDEVVERAAAFPAMVVSIDGVFRLALLRDHDPERFATLRQLVAQGSWRVAGPLWEATDCLVPGPESLIRQVAVGQRFLESELGVDPRYAFLPDCFGFPAALPSVLAHCGLRGFLTQKLARGPVRRAARPIPFPIGWWEGPDGARVLAILEPGNYGDRLTGRVQDRPEVALRLTRQLGLSGHAAAVMLVGVGDQGGAPETETMEHLIESVASPGSPVVEHVGADVAFDQLADLDGLPTSREELLLSLHGPGCYTSKVGMKRWNRLNERLAFAAEAAAAVAARLGLAPWPTQRLDAAWQRLLWHQFHDDLTGTSTPDAYAVSWHDEAAAALLFAGVLRSSLERLAGQLDTSGPGQAFVVWNDLPRRREGLVELTLDPGTDPDGLVAIGADGAPLVTQSVRSGEGQPALLVRVSVGGVGLVVVRVVPGMRPGVEEPVTASRSGLSNAVLTVGFDSNGEVASLHHREFGELLAGPCGFELLRHRSQRFPAWEIHRETLAASPSSRVRRGVEVEVVEAGPLRAVVEVRRRERGVAISQRFALAAGDDVLDTRARVDWSRRGALLKACFPLAPRDATAWFDGGWGAVARPPNSAELWEVPAREWVASEGGGGGVAIVSPHRHGWDQPAPGLLRSTLVHSPRTGLGRRFRHQGQLDHGTWEVGWQLFGYRGTWRDAAVPARAEAGCRPLQAFATASHPGPLGRSAAWLEAPEALAVTAFGLNSRSGSTFVRTIERHGRPGTHTITSPLLDREPIALDGCDRPLADPDLSVRQVATGLEASFGPFAGRSWAASDAALVAPVGEVVHIASTRACPGLLGPASLESEGISFELSIEDGVVRALDGTMTVEGRGRLHLLAFAAGGGSALAIGDTSVALPDGTLPLAEEELPGGWFKGGRPARVERTPLATLLPRVDEAGRRLPYQFVALFHLTCEVTGSTIVSARGPANILAVTLDRTPPPRLEPCVALVDADLGGPSMSPFQGSGS